MNKHPKCHFCKEAIKEKGSICIFILSSTIPYFKLAHNECYATHSILHPQLSGKSGGLDFVLNSTYSYLTMFILILGIATNIYIFRAMEMSISNLIPTLVLTPMLLYLVGIRSYYFLKYELHMK